MVEVFKTNIDNSAIAQQIVNEIKDLLFGIDASFDLDDCDRILRVCGSFEPPILKDQVIALVNSKGYMALLLDDEIGFTAHHAEEQALKAHTGIIAFLSIR